MSSELGYLAEPAPSPPSPPHPLSAAAKSNPVDTVARAAALPLPGSPAGSSVGKVEDSNAEEELDGSEVGLAISEPPDSPPPSMAGHPFAQGRVPSPRYSGGKAPNPMLGGIPYLPREGGSSPLNPNTRGVQLHDRPLPPAPAPALGPEDSFTAGFPLPPSEIGESPYQIARTFSLPPPSLPSSPGREEFNRNFRYPSVASAPPGAPFDPTSPHGVSSMSDGSHGIGNKEKYEEDSNMGLQWKDPNYDEIEREEDERRWKKKVKMIGIAILVLLIIIGIGVGAGIGAQNSANKKNNAAVASSSSSTSTSSSSSRRSSSLAATNSDTSSTSVATSTTTLAATRSSVSTTLTAATSDLTTSSLAGLTRLSTSTDSITSASRTIVTSATQITTSATTTSARGRTTGIVCQVGGMTLGGIVLGGSATTLPLGSSCATATAASSNARSSTTDTDPQAGLFEPHKRWRRVVRH